MYGLVSRALQVRQLLLHFLISGGALGAGRVFRHYWFNHFKWLHYDVGEDAAYSFVCCKAVKEGKMRLSSYTEDSFLVKGFINCKDPTRVFGKHESCGFHKSTASALASRVTSCS